MDESMMEIEKDLLKEIKQSKNNLIRNCMKIIELYAEWKPDDELNLSDPANELMKTRLECVVSAHKYLTILIENGGTEKDINSLST